MSSYPCLSFTAAATWNSYLKVNKSRTWTLLRPMLFHVSIWSINTECQTNSLLNRLAAARLDAIIHEEVRGERTASVTEDMHMNGNMGIERLRHGVCWKTGEIWNAPSWKEQHLMETWNAPLLPPKNKAAAVLHYLYTYICVDAFNSCAFTLNNC